MLGFSSLKNWSLYLENQQHYKFISITAAADIMDTYGYRFGRSEGEMLESSQML